MDTRQEIVSALRGLPARDFISTYLFDRIPHLFSDNRRSYILWKATLARAIDVDPACVTLVGTSAMGISLNPGKAFKSFDEKSDIDVAVVSNYHFTVAWRFLRTQGHLRTHVDAKTRTAWDEHVNRFIYWGTIATDKLLGILPFGPSWLAAVTRMALMDPTVGRDIKLRVYSDYESLRTYQVLSAQRAREEILSGGEPNAPVS